MSLLEENNVLLDNYESYQQNMTYLFNKLECNFKQCEGLEFEGGDRKAISEMINSVSGDTNSIYGEFDFSEGNVFKEDGGFSDEFRERLQDAYPRDGAWLQGGAKYEKMENALKKYRSGSGRIGKKWKDLRNEFKDTADFHMRISEAKTQLDSFKQEGQSVENFYKDLDIDGLKLDASKGRDKQAMESLLESMKGISEGLKEPLSTEERKFRDMAEKIQRDLAKETDQEGKSVKKSGKFAMGAGLLGIGIGSGVVGAILLGGAALAAKETENTPGLAYQAAQQAKCVCSCLSNSSRLSGAVISDVKDEKKEIWDDFWNRKDRGYGDNDDKHNMDDYSLVSDFFSNILPRYIFNSDNYDRIIKSLKYLYITKIGGSMFFREPPDNLVRDDGKDLGEDAQDIATPVSGFWDNLKKNLKIGTNAADTSENPIENAAYGAQVGELVWGIIIFPPFAFSIIYFISVILLMFVYLTDAIILSLLNKSFMNYKLLRYSVYIIIFLLSLHIFYLLVIFQIFRKPHDLDANLPGNFPWEWSENTGADNIEYSLDDPNASTCFPDSLKVDKENIIADEAECDNGILSGKDTYDFRACDSPGYGVVRDEIGRDVENKNTCDKCCYLGINNTDYEYQKNHIKNWCKYMGGCYPSEFVATQENNWWNYSTHTKPKDYYCWAKGDTEFNELDACDKGTSTPAVLKGEKCYNSCYEQCITSISEEPTVGIYENIFIYILTTIFFLILSWFIMKFILYNFASSKSFTESVSSATKGINVKSPSIEDLKKTGSGKMGTKLNESGNSKVAYVYKVFAKLFYLVYYIIIVLMVIYGGKKLISYI